MSSVERRDFIEHVRNISKASGIKAQVDEVISQISIEWQKEIDNNDLLIEALTFQTKSSLYNIKRRQGWSHEEAQEYAEEHWKSHLTEPARKALVASDFFNSNPPIKKT